MIQNGTRPRKLDRRKYSFHRTFGSMVSEVPAEFNFDAGLGFPNQNAIGTIDYFPNGCTGITQKELCQDMDQWPYLSKYTYDKTLQMEGINLGDPRFENVGCDIGDSLKSTIVYGLDDGKGGDPLMKRRGAYYDALDGSGMDAFDSIISAMWTNYLKTGKKTSVSFGCPWFREFEITDANGLISTPITWSLPAGVPWHNSKISGVKIINGVSYLIDKSWQGTLYGAGGYCHFSREQINALCAIPGVCADVLAPFTGVNVQNVKISILETVLSYLRIWYTELT